MKIALLRAERKQRVSFALTGTEAWLGSTARTRLGMSLVEILIAILGVGLLATRSAFHSEAGVD